MVQVPLIKVVRCVEIFYLRAWVSVVVLIVYKYASYYEALPTYRYLGTTELDQSLWPIIACLNACLPTT